MYAAVLVLIAAITMFAVCSIMGRIAYVSKDKIKQGVFIGLTFLFFILSMVLFIDGVRRVDHLENPDQPQEHVQLPFSMD